MSTTTTTTTTITNATATVTARATATLVVAGIDGGSASVVFTLPGGVQRTVSVSGVTPARFGPFPAEQDFSITATGTVQAAETFTDTATPGNFTTLQASSLLNFTGVEASVTAFAGGGQADATALSATANMHRVGTVATAADSVKLPASTVGQMHLIRNDGANAMRLFGTGTDTVNGAAAATGISVAAGTGLVAFCVEEGKWVTA